MFARRFEDNAERIEAIREFVSDDIAVGVDYADKDNPVIKLYNEGRGQALCAGKCRRLCNQRQWQLPHCQARGNHIRANKSEMTPTDRPQKPRECKYHNAKYCEASMYYTNGGKTIVMQPCRLCEPNISHCPDFTPKKDKQ